jgi:[ribosomal protein S18]-alanine N-acetyltransferase
MNNTISMHRMRWWHIEQVAALERSVFGDTAWSPSQFWGELARDNRTYYVLLDSAGKSDGAGETVCGYAGLATVPPEGDIQTVAVAPGIQGMGWGSRLVATLLEEARRQGCTSVLLEVASGNDAAVKLYEQQGFDVIARRSSYYGPGRDALIMRWRKGSGHTS